MAAKAAMPVKLPAISMLYATTRLAMASKARPIACPRPTKLKAIKAKNAAPITHMGMTQRLGSAGRYSVPK